MLKNQKKKNIIIKNIINYINSDLKLKNKFNHPNRKYKIKYLLTFILQILVTGLSFRKLLELSTNNVHWNTVYKFFMRLLFNLFYKLNNETTIAHNRICLANSIESRLSYKNIILLH